MGHLSILGELLSVRAGVTGVVASTSRTPTRSGWSEAGHESHAGDTSGISRPTSGAASSVQSFPRRR